MGKLASKRRRRAKKHMNAGRAPRPHGAAPGKSAGARGVAGGKKLGSDILEHFTGIDVEGTLGAAGFGGKGGMAGLLGRRRRINPANIKALRRSIRRVEGFEKIAKKVVRFVHPTRHVGHMAFKRRVRRKAI